MHAFMSNQTRNHQQLNACVSNSHLCVLYIKCIQGRLHYLYVNLFSSFLYDLYLENKGLPNVSDVNVLRKWINKLSKEIGIEFRYTKSLMQRLYKRTSLIVNKVKKLRRQGGRQMVKYLKEEWAMQLSSKDKKTCHQDVVEKQLRSERDSLLKENIKLHKHSNSLQSQVTTLSGQLQKACSSGYKPTRGPSKRKSPSQYTDRHNRELKRMRKDKCSSSLAWLQFEGYSVTQVKMVNTTTGKEEKIDLNPEDLLGPDENSITESEMDTINMMLFIKDRYNISGAAYNELSQVCKDMPRHYKLKDRIRELNKLWNIKPTPNGTCGVQQSFTERLQFCLHGLVRMYVQTILYCLYIFPINMCRGSYIYL